MFILLSTFFVVSSCEKEQWFIVLVFNDYVIIKSFYKEMWIEISLRTGSLMQVGLLYIDGAISQFRVLLKRTS